MDKNIAKKILKRERIPKAEFIKFLSEFLDYKNKKYTSQEFTGLLQAIEMRIIDIQPAIKELALTNWNWDITDVLDMNGNLIRRDIYDTNKDE